MRPRRSRAAPADNRDKPPRTGPEIRARGAEGSGGPAQTQANTKINTKINTKTKPEAVFQGFGSREPQGSSSVSQ